MSHDDGMRVRREVLGDEHVDRATAGQTDELAMHVRAARRNGLTQDEIKEVLLQCAIYCGVPAANAAFAVAQRVLAEDDAKEEEG